MAKKQVFLHLLKYKKWVKKQKNDRNVDSAIKKFQMILNSESYKLK